MASMLEGHMDPTCTLGVLAPGIGENQLEST